MTSTNESFALDFGDVATFAHRFATPDAAVAAQKALRSKITTASKAADKATRVLSVYKSAMAFNAFLNGVIIRSGQTDSTGAKVTPFLTHAKYAEAVGLSGGSMGVYLNAGQALVNMHLDPASDEVILPARNEDGDSPVTHRVLWSWLYGKAAAGNADVAGYLRANADSTDLAALAEVVRSVVKPSKAEREARKAAKEQAERNGEGNEADAVGAGPAPVNEWTPETVISALGIVADALKLVIADVTPDQRQAIRDTLASMAATTRGVRPVDAPADEAPATDKAPATVKRTRTRKTA
jgi:hypothetical protein